MGEKELREKYGGKLLKAINRAIRAEITGGNEALDRLTNLAGAARHSNWKDRLGKETAEASEYFKHKKEVVDRMDSQIRRKYDIPADAGKEPEPKRGGSTRRGGKSGPPKKRGGPKR